MSDLLGYISLTGLFLSLVVFFYNRGYIGSNRFLGSFFFFACLYTFGLCIGMYGDSLKLTALFGPTTIPFFYLLGPFSYLYVRSVLRDSAKISRSDYLHFLLFFIQVGGLLPFYLSSWEHKLEIARIIHSENWTLPFLSVNVIPAKINYVIRPLQMSIYLIIQWYLVLKYNWKDRPWIPSAQLKTTRRWLVIFLGVTTLWFINTINIVIDHIRYSTRSVFLQHIGPALILAGIILIILIICLLLYPQVLYGLPRVIAVTVPEPNQKDLTERPIKEPPQDLVTKLPELNARLESLVKKNKPFLDPDFSINSLSAELKVPVHHLRYYFGQYLDISFTTYKNRLRAEFVKKLIQAGESDKHSVEGLGHMAGFSSKSTFFSAFKAETGMSPLEYLRTFRQGPDMLS